MGYTDFMFWAAPGDTGEETGEIRVNKTGLSAPIPPPLVIFFTDHSKQQHKYAP